MTGRPRRLPNAGLRSDALSGLFLLLLAAFAWLAAQDLPFGTLHRPGPGFFPKSLACLTGGLAALLAVRAMRGDGQDVRSLWPDRSGAIRVALLLAVVLGYVIALEPGGYLLVTACLFLVLLRWVGRRSWSETVGITLLVAAGSYLLFARWLMVSLPAGLFAP